MKRFLLFTLSLSLLIVLPSYGQEYKTGIGLRAGLANGITAKHFIKEKNAVEGIVSIRWEGFNITGLYETHYSAFNTKGLYWFWGFGGHLGFWEGDNVGWADDSNSHTVIGVDGVLGLEYNFQEAPINLSLDWKPAFNLIGHTGFWGDGAGLSIRYLIQQ